jgi:hypothetical protein
MNEHMAFRGRGGRNRGKGPVQRWDGDKWVNLTLPPGFLHTGCTDFAWGYGGDGPADLARAILAWVLPPKDACLLYRAFKEDFVMTWPVEGWKISAAEILQWRLGEPRPDSPSGNRYLIDEDHLGQWLTKETVRRIKRGLA